MCSVQPKQKCQNLSATQGRYPLVGVAATRPDKKTTQQCSVTCVCPPTGVVCYQVSHAKAVTVLCRTYAHGSKQSHIQPVSACLNLRSRQSLSRLGRNVGGGRLHVLGRARGGLQVAFAVIDNGEGLAGRVGLARVCHFCGVPEDLTVRHPVALQTKNKGGAVMTQSSGEPGGGRERLTRIMPIALITVPICKHPFYLVILAPTVQVTAFDGGALDHIPVTWEEGAGDNKLAASPHVSQPNCRCFTWQHIMSRMTHAHTYANLFRRAQLLTRASAGTNFAEAAKAL